MAAILTGAIAAMAAPTHQILNAPRPEILHAVIPLVADAHDFPL